MKSILEACLVGAILIYGCAAQENIPLKRGVSVQMAVASQAAEMPAADGPNATVVAITADGKVFVGVNVTEPGALGKLSDETVYVKADARASYQTVLAVLDALRGKSVVLLTAPPATAAGRGIVHPYGVKLVVFQ